MELCEVPADGVYGYVGILEAEALARYSHPGHPRLGDVERAHAQRLTVHVYFSVLLQRSQIIF